MASARPERLSTVLGRLVAIEFTVAVLAAELTIRLYYWLVLQAHVYHVLYISSSFLIAGIYLSVTLGFRQYNRVPLRRKLWFVTGGVAAVIAAFSLFLSILFLLKLADAYSRGTFFFQLIAVSCAIAAVRAISHDRLRAAIAKNKIEARRVVMIGPDPHCAELADQFRASGLHVQANFANPPEGDHATVSEYVRQIAQRCRPLCADEVVVLATERDIPNVELLAGALSELPVSLHIMPIGLKKVLATASFTELGTVATFQLLRPPLSPVEAAFKRCFDLIVAAVGLIVLAPLFLVVATVIAMESPGPVIFRQLRHGFNNELIRVFKFRTMRSLEDGRNFTQAARNDPRVTRFGSILRQTNIDELPQLFNVLLGEMSLVGPRPHPIALNESFQNSLSPLYRRHNVKPGLTGWAQVNGYRGQTDTLDKMQKRLEYDLYYIDHWSFLFDIQIICMTLLSKEAYANAY